MKRFLLPLIFLTGLLLRLVSLESFPVGLTPDEASFGYDAYSILTTGKDQWGKTLPLVFESFGDFKSPLYTYLTVPSVFLFGLTKFAVRLPNAILGSFAVLVIYHLTRVITKKEKVAVVAATLLAISPWHIMLSRGAFEANLITLLLPLGIYLFLVGKESKSALIFGLSLLSYHSAKLIAPIVFIALALLFKMKKAVPIVIFSLFFGIMIYSNSLGGATRIAERSIYQGALEDGARTKIALINEGMNPILARLLHNKYQVTASRFINNYKQYFSKQFLFTKGPAETTYGMIPGIGVIYFFEGLFFIGLIPLIRKGKLRGVITLLIGLLLLAPVPAALATGVGYSANRAAAMIPALTILSAIGAYGVSNALLGLNKRWIIVATIAVAFLVSRETGTAYKAYFTDSPITASHGMLYGNLEAATYLKDNKGDKEVLVSKSLSEPHIYIAFANRWDPNDYQKESVSWNYKEIGVNWVDQMPNYSLGEYTFTTFDPKNKVIPDNILVVGRPNEFIDRIVPLTTINYPDGTPSILIVDPKGSQYAKAN